MKVSIEYKDNDYIIEFDRKTASEIGKAIAALPEDTDEFTKTELMLKYSLKKNHADLPATLTDEIVDFIIENYALIDTVGENGETEKGLLTVINEMLEAAIPKGFTKGATLKFKVVE